MTIFDGDGTRAMGRMIAKGGNHEGDGGGRRDTTRKGERRDHCVWEEGRKAEKVKWLGVILDSNLRFEEHVLSRAKRAREIVGIW